MPPPRLAIVSIVRNEADIVETFVRHHAAFATRMVFVLHRCIDSTEEILRALAQEGLPVEIHRHAGVEHPQSSALSEHIRRLVTEGAAEWIAPLDADEFLVAAEGKGILDALATSDAHRVLTLGWKTYVPTPEDDATESNPIRRIVHRKEPEFPAFRKVILPAALLRRMPWNMPLGSHAILHGATGEALPSLASAALAIAHFPVRNAEQLTAKIVGGCVALAATPDPTPQRGYHWHALRERLTTGRPVTPGELRNMALRYAVPDGVVAVPGLLRDPVETPAGRPRLRIQPAHPMAVLMDAALAGAERLAEYERLDERSADGNSRRSALVRAMRSGIERLRGPLADALPAGDALLCALALSSACTKTPDTAGSALARRQRLADALPPLPPDLQWLRSLLTADKLPMTLENAIQHIMRICSSVDEVSLRQECRRDGACDDVMLALATDLTGEVQPPTPLPLATFLAQTAHQMLLREASIPLGLADHRVRMISPDCGRGEIAGEVLRRAARAHFERGGNPDVLRQHILRQTYLTESSPTLRAIAALRWSGILDALRMPLGDGETLPLSGDHGSIPSPNAINIPVVSNALTERSGPPLSPEAQALFARYLQPLQRNGMDRDAGSSPILQRVAAAHALLRNAQYGIAALIAPRWLLHAHAARGMRELLLQDFEQIRILDLHGERPGDVESAAGDEPVDGGDMSGTCMLLLLRAPTAAQRAFFTEWKGLRLQKYHALLSRNMGDLPWQVIAPQAPGYLFLPS